MPLTAAGSFRNLQAPCGRIVGGQTFEDHDEETQLTEELDYECGCRSIRHAYHDGSVSHRLIRHDGTVLLDELLSAE